jgi:flagellin
MGFSIRTNVSSLVAQTNLAASQLQLDSSQSKLSSGLRITKAGDDAAGLGISTSLEADISSYNQAARNANDGIGIIQTAEGALNETTNLFNRLRQLAIQSSSDGVGNTERGYINNEATQLTNEIDRIANSTEYNGTKLLAAGGTTLDFQVGIRNVAANDRISVSSIDATSATLLTAAIDLSTKATAQTAIGNIDTALQSVSSARATFGAVGNRFNSVVNTIATATVNLTAADARIRDVNVAEESSNQSRLSVLVQAGVSVLAQANQGTQALLKLLQ